MLKRKLKDFTGAIADWNKAIELNPNHPFAFSNIEFNKRKLKDDTGAIAD